MVRQIDQVREVSVTIDAGESIAAPFGRHRKRGALRFRREDVSRLAPCGIVVGRAPLGLPDRLSRPCFVDHLGDANAVVRKDLLATDRLDLMMVGVGPPGRQRPLVPPYLVGQQQVLPRQTPEAIDEEAADPWPQARASAKRRDSDIDPGARALSELQRTDQSSEFPCMRPLRDLFSSPSPASASSRHRPGSRLPAGSGAIPRSRDQNACW